MANWPTLPPKLSPDNSLQPLITAGHQQPQEIFCPAACFKQGVQHLPNITKPKPQSCKMHGTLTLRFLSVLLTHMIAKCHSETLVICRPS